MEEQGGGWLPTWVKLEWEVIVGAPRAFLVSLAIISAFIAIALYWLFKVNLELKTDHIVELTAANASLKDENERLKSEATTLNSKHPNEEASKEVQDIKKDYPDVTKPFISTEELVSNKTFTNEVVEMDGKKFKDCRFVNVTLNFKGIGTTTLINSHFVGFTQLITNNWAVKAYTGLMEEFKKHPGVTNIIVGERDENGAVHVLSNTKLNHTPNPTPAEKK